MSALHASLAGRSPPDVRTPGEVGTNSRALREKDEAIVCGAADERKTFATLRAQAAMASHVLDRHVDESGAVTYTASRWCWTRTFNDLESVERWLRSVTGRRARIDADNREQDRRDEVADYERGPGGQG